LATADIKEAIPSSTPMIATGMLDSWKASTSFADRRTDLGAVGLSPTGQSAVRELISLSPRREIRVIAGLTTATVALYGELGDLTEVDDRLLIESLPSANRGVVQIAA
jgi:hypothetical protein